MNFLVDVETSGLEPFRHEILTMYCIVTDKELRVQDEREFKFRVNELHAWNEESALVHGISIVDAQLFPDRRESFNNLVKFLESFGESFQFICHAKPFRSRIDLFDYRHIHAMFWQNDERETFERLFPERLVYSTILSSRKEALARWGVEKQSLDVWAKKLGIELDHHDAKSDTKALLEVYKYQQERKDFEMA